ncbi:MAG: zinc ABC transporter substrate-binding protein [Propionibacteriales bacterium]|nr:zinc ABC transporter substrate-binding protein [Propionibacteriales bacterium]
MGCMRIQPVTLLGVGISAALLAACGDGSPVAREGPSVVAGFYPYAYVAERVAGDRASVANLTSTGGEPHDLELGPQQVAEVSEADVVIHQAGFQPSLDEAVELMEDGAALDVTDVVELQDTGAPADSHADEEGHEPEEHEADEDLSGDPHAWQDPTKLAGLGRAVADALAETDPDRADDYHANAEALSRDLADLDTEFRRGLADCERSTFVTSHAAFGYLAQRYDLEMIAISGLSPDAEPSLARMRELQDLAEDEGITTVFSETLADPRLSETLADEVGVTTEVLDPIEGLTDETAEEDYFSLMRSNLQKLREANGCR